MNQRLELGKGFVRFTRAEQQEGRAAGDTRGRSVREQVDGMVSDVEAASDLDRLKLSVRSRLDHIVASMDRFKESETERESTVSRELRELITRIDSMEEESKRFRDQLQQQQVKAMKDALT